MLAAKVDAASRESSAAPSVNSVSIGDGASELRSEAPLKFSILGSKRGWGSLANKMKNKSTVPLKRYESTYKTEPDPGQAFDCAKVEGFIFDILETILKGQQYKGTICRNLASMSTLSDVIKGRLKRMGFPRQKIIVYTVLGEKLQQDIKICSRAVWDDKTDNHVTVPYENESLYAVVTIYAVYFE